MALPFTTEQFFGVFRAYNEAVWPAQLPLTVLAIVAIFLSIRPMRWSGEAIAGILGFFWLWIALTYHLHFFAEINPLAYAFGAASIIGALAFLWFGTIRRRLKFRVSLQSRGLVGLALVGYALVGYPIFSIYAGHRYPEFPTFGLPCPTTLFTVGLLCFLEPPFPRAPVVVPVVWSLVGVQAALLLGVPQDLGLLAAAAVGIHLWSVHRG